MLLSKKTEGREAERVDPPKCSILSRKKKECFGAQGAKLELLTTQTLNHEEGSARREADKRQRKAASDAKIIWTGGLPHLSGLPHLPGVPHGPTCV